jgi:hypothetical protein
MVTRKSSKPAGRDVSDDEVKTPHHDDVLNWLIDNLQNVVVDVWRVSDEKIEKSLESARAAAKNWIAHFGNRLKDFAEGKKEPEKSRMHVSYDPPEKLQVATWLLPAALRTKPKHLQVVAMSHSLTDRSCLGSLKK